MTAANKQSISIRLSPDVLDALRATDPGWQAGAENVLRSHYVTMTHRAVRRKETAAAAASREAAAAGNSGSVLRTGAMR